MAGKISKEGFIYDSLQLLFTEVHCERELRVSQGPVGQSIEAARSKVDSWRSHKSDAMTFGRPGEVTQFRDIQFDLHGQLSVILNLGSKEGKQHGLMGSKAPVVLDGFLNNGLLHIAAVFKDEGDLFDNVYLKGTCWTRSLWQIPRNTGP